MTNFSIVFQGKYEDKYLTNVLSSLKYTKDVVVSTWFGCISPDSMLKLKAAGVKIVENIDPGSIIGYYQDGLVKQHNVIRMLTGVYNGAQLCMEELIVKSRLDIALDFDKFISEWLKSGKEFASVNATSNCPTRAFGYPYLFCVSDWCFGVPRSCIEKLNPKNLIEKDFELKSPILVKDTEWHVRIGAEQILCLILTQPKNVLLDFRNMRTLEEIDIKYRDMHEESLARFCNVNRCMLNFKSDKYNAYGVKWINYDKADFSDNKFLKSKLHQLPIYLASAIYRKIRTWRSG